MNHLRSWLMLVESENYQWIQTSDADFAATFTIGDVPYAVYFDLGTKFPSVANVIFAAMADPNARWDINAINRQALTPEDFGEHNRRVSPYNVYTTVGQVIKDFLAHHHEVTILRFTGATQRQTELYRKLIRKLGINGFQVKNIGRHFLFVKNGETIPPEFSGLH